jgi:Family of unknown function (DUF6151)
MTHALRCNCGKLKGTLKHTTEINRCVCYCADCQAFARFLKREHDILDAVGGTSIVQTIPKHVNFLEGAENLACIRLTETGLLRWYAACYFVPTNYLICLCTGTLEGRNNYAVGADSRR